jgi:hypothetical protein
MSSVFLKIFKNFFVPKNAATVPKKCCGPKITADSGVGLPIIQKPGRGNRGQTGQRLAFKLAVGN